MANKNKTHYTREEAEHLLRALTDADLDRATLYSERISGRASGAYDARELLDEAYVRTLDGSRRWKVGMRGPEHLFGAMRSIQNSWLKQQKRSKAGQKRFIMEIKADDESSITEWPVEQLVDLQQRATELLEGRELNLVEKCVLSGFIDGLEPKAIVERCRITAKRYVETLLSLSGKLDDNTGE